MAKKSPRLNPRQRLAALALAEGSSREEAAARAGTSLRSIHRWVTLQLFNDEIGRIQDAFYSEAIGRAIASAGKATLVLESLIDNSETPPAVKVQSAQAILNFADRVFKQRQLEQRLAELEAYYATNRKNKAT